MGCLVVSLIVAGLIISSEYNYYGDGKSIGYWILGFVTGISATLLTILGIWG